jgi:betaine-homocysteine S-methyltransferase
MRVIGKEELLEPLNKAALRIAKNVADTPQNDKDEPDLMAGNISNTNIWDPEDPAKQKEVEGMFEEMCGWAVEEGADMLIGETFYYAEEAYAALRAMKKFNVPCVVTVSPMGENIMREGISPVEACIELEKRGAEVVGMNCFRGPQTMMPFLREIRKAVDCHMAALPVTYRTTEAHPTFFNLPDEHGCQCPSPHGRTFPTALDPLYVNRYEMRQFAEDALELGIKYLGICCGNSPTYLREVAMAAGKMPQAARFQENMANHFMYGSNERIPKHIKGYGSAA